MISFKKISLLSLILIPLTFISAGAYEIYVSNLELNNTEFTVGDIVNGTFNISNVKEVSQSDIYYSIYTGEYAENGVDLKNSLGITEKIGPIYLNGLSDKQIAFTYVLPDSITEDAGVEVVAELRDGTVVGWENIKISISGEVKTVVISPTESKLVINGEELGVETGPTISEDDEVYLSYTLPKTNFEQTLTPSIKLFNRVHNTGVIYEEIFQDIITSTEEETIHRISLPKDLDPLVYTGTLSVEGESASVENIFFNYIIGGDIATIHNVNSNKLSVVEGEEFITTVKYSGVPYNFINPEEQIVLETADLNIIILGTEGLVAEYIGEINLSEGAVSIPLTAMSNSEELNYQVTISKNGDILSEYETILIYEPIEGEEEAQKDAGMSLLIYLAALIMFLVIIFLIITRRDRDVVIFPILAGLSYWNFY